MTRWYSERKNEYFYKEAKRDGYRSRSAFKLKQIQKKYRLLKKGNIVIDLGAAPGGWSQVAKEIVGDDGLVLGIDLSPIKPIKGVTFLKGDITKESSLQELIKSMKEKKADAVISDMSPNISGNYSVDHARSIFLCKQALITATTFLKSSGNFLCKVFDGEELPRFLNDMKNSFGLVKKFSPPASRKSSSEIYVIAKSFKKN
jgi:23S rRNA (uridine2552-2'-O)-methyltransferase